MFRSIVFTLSILPVSILQANELNVMTYNIYWGGTSSGEPLSQTAEVIKKAGAQVVGIQENYTWDERGSAFYRDQTGELAQMLGWDYLTQSVEVDGTWNDVSILSQHPIKSVTEDGLCAQIDVDGTSINFCNIHLQSAPYQPYQLNNIEYKNAPFIKTEEAAIAYANWARGNGIDHLLNTVEALEGPVVVVGDFNEPSHQDWTDAAAAANLHPIAVAYPQTSKLVGAGFVDAYRKIHTDSVKQPGLTWTPTTAEDAKDDHHDRIDYIFLKEANVSSAQVVGEKSERADIVVTPWPSDHRAVVATIKY